MARSSSGVFSRPLVRELDVSPAVLRRLAARFPERYPVLFDSAAEGPLSQASVLVAEPRAALWLDASGHLGSEGVLPRGTTFLSALENWWLAEREPVPPSASQSTASRAQAGDALAFAGGCARFLGYEIAQEVEPRLSLPRATLPWQAFALRTPGAVVHERGRGRVVAVAGGEAVEALERLEPGA